MEKTSGAMIRSKHVLLALLKWDTSILPPKSAAVLDLDGYAKGALAVFLHMDSVDEVY